MHTEPRGCGLSHCQEAAAMEMEGHPLSDAVTAAAQQSTSGYLVGFSKDHLNQKVTLWNSGLMNWKAQGSAAMGDKGNRRVKHTALPKPTPDLHQPLLPPSRPGSPTGAPRVERPAGDTA